MSLTQFRAKSWAGDARSWRDLVILGLLLLVAYSYFFPRWADWNQNSRLNLVMAIVDEHRLAIDSYVGNTGDYAFFNEHYYSDKAPGLSFLAVPPYAMFRAILPESWLTALQRTATTSSALGATLREGGASPAGSRLYFFVVLTMATFTVVVVPSVALGLLVFVVMGRLGCSRGEQWSMTVLYALGTSAFPYAQSFVGHQTTAFFLMVTFAVAFAVRRALISPSWLILAGFSLGWAITTEYPAALIGLVLAIYVVHGKQPIARIVQLGVGMAPPLLLLAAYDYAIFGTVLPVGYTHSVLWTDVHSEGLVSLTYPRLDALWGLTFGEHRGLFFLSPILLLSIVGYVVLWRAAALRAEFWVLLGAPLSFLLFSASSAMWQGGFAVGPRYLVPSLPFLALAASLGLRETWRHRPWRPIVLLAGGWSLCATWVQTISGQAFPDYTANPLFELSLPRLASGDIARNFGMLFGLAGWSSLLPLAVILVAGAVIIWISHWLDRDTDRWGTLANQTTMRPVGWRPQ